jgi:Rieske Fe-S protein
MTTKKVLLALAATSFLALGTVVPAYAQDDPPAADDGTMTEVPADPDSMEPGDTTQDPGTEEGDGTNMDSGTEGGTEGGDQPQ